MKVPARLEELLQRDQRLSGAVHQTLANFEPWLADNKVVFFPGYTDHGPDHVENVMRGAEALIRDAAWEFLTARDAGVLVLAILLHDCAMHLSPDGFLCIIDSSRPWNPTAHEFLTRQKDPPWRSLWEEFLRRATRFDERKLLNIFGDATPVRRPPDDPVDWTDRDRLLIGDFLRIHHARLAHEIGLAGVPGPHDDRLRFADLDTWICDLAGFAARSHNLDLRNCTDAKTMPPNGRKVWRDIHVPFIMAILRIADYLEITAPRAPKQVLQVRSLRSPLSRNEWGLLSS